jgi:hypothetical protein
VINYRRFLHKIHRKLIYLLKLQRYGATVTVSHVNGGDGFNAKPFTQELLDNFNRASIANFGKPSLTCGEGGSIPFMNFL